MREILVAPGDIVRAGQPLLNVSSPDYSAARASYAKVREVFQLADRNYKRSQDLYAHKAIAQKDLEQAESDRSVAQSDVESAGDALRALGIADPDAKPSTTLQIPVLSPAAGEIVERLVGPEARFFRRAQRSVSTISDTGKVWVLVRCLSGRHRKRVLYGRQR